MSEEVEILKTFSNFMTALDKSTEISDLLDDVISEFFPNEKPTIVVAGILGTLGKMMVENDIELQPVIHALFAGIIQEDRKDLLPEKIANLV